MSTASSILTSVSGTLRGIAIDPVALNYVLGAVEAVTMPDAETITKDSQTALAHEIPQDPAPYAVVGSTTSQE
jgi:hypothetical protein